MNMQKAYSREDRRIMRAWNRRQKRILKRRDNRMACRIEQVAY